MLQTRIWSVEIWVRKVSAWLGQLPHIDWIDVRLAIFLATYKMGEKLAGAKVTQFSLAYKGLCNPSQYPPCETRDSVDKTSCTIFDLPWFVLTLMEQIFLVQTKLKIKCFLLLCTYLMLFSSPCGWLRRFMSLQHLINILMSRSVTEMSNFGETAMWNCDT